MSQELLLLSGSAHPELAQAIAEKSFETLVDAEIGQFPDGETKVKINDNVREKDVFIIQPTGPPVDHNIMELLIISDALRRSSAGRVTAVTPYFGYARQDRKDESRVPISAKLAIDLFENAGIGRICSIDLHAGQIQGFTNIPIDHLYARKTIVNAMRDVLDHPVIAAPDLGAGKKARKIAKMLNTEWAIVDKDREDDKVTRVAAIVGHSVRKRNVLIVDDIISSGGTILSAAEALKNKGALQVFAAITHGVLCGDAVEQIEASPYLDKLFVTDSLPGPVTRKIGRISISTLLANAIKNIHAGESVSDLFN
jgi:ribose-phosphate pyrophosphokinase